jgi:hypothetical protein
MGGVCGTHGRDRGCIESFVGANSLGDVGINRANNEKGRKEISLDVMDWILYLRRERVEGSFWWCGTLYRRCIKVCCPYYYSTWETGDQNYDVVKEGGPSETSVCIRLYDVTSQYTKSHIFSAMDGLN